MSDDELEKKARAEYEAAREPRDPVWPDLPGYRQALWRERILGAAGVAED